MKSEKHKKNTAKIWGMTFKDLLKQYKPFAIIEKVRNVNGKKKTIAVFKDIEIVADETMKLDHIILWPKSKLSRKKRYKK